MSDRLLATGQSPARPTTGVAGLDRLGSPGTGLRRTKVFPGCQGTFRRHVPSLLRFLLEDSNATGFLGRDCRRPTRNGGLKRLFALDLSR
jgi:hypothetical protein